MHTDMEIYFASTTVVIELALLVLSASLLVYCYCFRKWNTPVTKLPVGPLGMPFLGHLLLFVNVKHIQRNLRQIGKKYGGIFTLRIGKLSTVWISSYELFEEAMVSRGWDCAGRPPELPIPHLDPSGKGYRNMVHTGVDSVDCQVRDFVRKKLKTFGFGQSCMQMRIIEEVNYLTNEIEQNCLDIPFNPASLFAKASANITCTILFGQRYEYNDTKHQQIMQQFSDGVRLLVKAKIDEAFPILKNFPRKVTQECFEKYRSCTEYLKNLVQENHTAWQESNPRNFMDVWMDKSSKNADEKIQNIYDVDRLPLVLGPLFIGSFDTTTITLSWIFAMLLNKPELQRKVHAEIDRTIASGDITLVHQPALVYTESIILETLRMFPPAPFNIPHFTVNDTTIGTHKIPKGTRIGIHLYSILHDEQLWTYPQEFRPERFIVNDQLYIPEYFVPFSRGRRSCMGEKLARKQLFLIFANVMNKFTVHSADVDNVPSLEVITEGLVMHPKPFKLVFQLRHDLHD